ncbi:MAG: hypothetical protein ACI9BW_003235 [Gammaproteobacteria bacterium]|jgi:hypothetical protein
MARIAKCHCGDLQAKCEGEPEHIFMCHCESCQRRTGSTYSVAAWFPKELVTTTGETKEYVRTGDGGSVITLNFCPNCGTNICFSPTGDLSPLIGVPVGCFVDPAFPPPTLSVYGKRRHNWVVQPDGCPSFTGDPNSELE